jgi:hypothetical protein
VGRRGHAIFAARLARFVSDVDEPRVRVIARRVAAGVSVAVHGRAGVGRGCVARGLAAAGVAVASDGAVDVHVVAEVVKPEDRDAIAASASTRPTLMVLNKADLIADPRARCARYQALTGVATVPMAAHLAVVEIDDGLFTALHTLAAGSCEFGSVDDFVTRPHRLSAEARVRLLDALDLYGTAQAVPALRAGADAAGVQRVLRRHSGVSAVVATLMPMLTEAAYQQVRWAITALEATAATADEGLAARIAAFLRDDDTVLGCMAAAVDVVEAAGMAVDPGDDPVTHLSRAAYWRRYHRGPVNAVHRACGADIVRGSLRLWRRTQTGAVT